MLLATADETLLVSIVALVIAGVSLVVSMYQARLSTRQADLAEAQTTLTQRQAQIAEEQHAAFLRELARQPELVINRVKLEGDAQPRIERKGDEAVQGRLEVGVDNIGAKTAPQVGLNLIAPANIGIGWLDPDGAEIPAKPVPPGELPERVQDTFSSVGTAPLHYLDLTVDISNKSLWHEYVAFEVPAGVSGPIPFTLTVTHESLAQMAYQPYELEVVPNG
jgi:hypothetical protein